MPGFAPEVDLDPKGDRDLARLMLRKERRTEFVFEEHRFLRQPPLDCQ